MIVMRSLSSLGFAVALAAFAAAPARAESADAARKEMAALHYVSGTQALPDSHGTFVTPKDSRMLVGADAKRADEILNGETTSDSEGLIERDHRTLYMSYDDSGYVTADDWKDVDAAKMLDDMKSATADENEERKKNGVDPFYVDRWVQPPTYDAAHRSVRWIMGLRSEDGTPFVNAVAMKLGRHGYEKFTLVSSGKDEAGDRAALAAFTNGYTFDKGFRFQDYVAGDKVAGFGLAALVGTGVGVTLAKTGLLATILLFAKKFIIIILAVGAGLFNRVRKMFSGKAKFGPPQAGSPPAPPAVR